MLCAECQNLLSDYLDGDISDRSRKAVGEHLEACAPCENLRDDLARLIEASANLPLHTPSPRVWEAIQREIGSMETTHGLIRLTWKDTPFLFVSGLVNRTLLFNVETSPRFYAQNFAAAHNAGITIGYLLLELARLNVANKLFD